MRTLAFALILPLLGCGLPRSPGSGDISTLDLSIDGTAHGDGTTTTVTLHVNSPVGDVLFSDGDRMTLTAGGAGRPLTAVEDKQGIHYEATFGDVDGAFTIDILRPHDRSVTGLAFLVPPSFGLTAPDISGDDAIAMTWNAGEGDYISTITINGVCIQPFGRTLAQDTGSYTVLTAELVPLDAGGRCPLELSLEREATTLGKVDTILDSGGFFARTDQTRKVTIAWGP